MLLQSGNQINLNSTNTFFMIYNVNTSAEKKELRAGTLNEIEEMN